MNDHAHSHIGTPGEHFAGVVDELLTQATLAVDCGRWSKPDFSEMEQSSLWSHQCLPYVAVLLLVHLLRDMYPDPWDFLREKEQLIYSVRTAKYRWQE